jgi:hypothetical protein
VADVPVGPMVGARVGEVGALHTPTHKIHSTLKRDILSRETCRGAVVKMERLCYNDTYMVGRVGVWVGASVGRVVGAVGSLWQDTPKQHSNSLIYHTQAHFPSSVQFRHD